MLVTVWRLTCMSYYFLQLVYLLITVAARFKA
jgi:hypothetical protein